MLARFWLTCIKWGPWSTANQIVNKMSSSHWLVHGKTLIIIRGSWRSNYRISLQACGHATNRCVYKQLHVCAEILHSPSVMLGREAWFNSRVSMATMYTQQNSVSRPLFRVQTCVMKNLCGCGIYGRPPSEAWLSWNYGRCYWEKETVRKLLERISKERHSSHCQGCACQHVCTRQTTRQIA